MVDKNSGRENRRGEMVDKNVERRRNRRGATGGRYRNGEKETTTNFYLQIQGLYPREKSIETRALDEAGNRDWSNVYG